MKKIIIVLIAILIFNIAIPPEAKAWDLAGILLKPVSTLLISILASIDITIGLTLNAISAATDAIGAIVEFATDDDRRGFEQRK